MSTPLPPTQPPGCVHVASLSQARRAKRRYTHLLTLEDPRAPANRRMLLHRVPGQPTPAHLVLQLEDVDTPLPQRRTRVATPAHAQAIVQFGLTSASGTLLVHCYHGVGRSAAAALGIACARAPLLSAPAAVAMLYALRPEVTPCHSLLAALDQVLPGVGLLQAVRQHEGTLPAKLAARATRAKFYADNPQLYASCTQEQAA